MNRIAIAGAALFLSASLRAGTTPAASTGALTLDDCYRRALARSETLVVSEQEVLRAEAQYRAARGTILPRVSFRALEFYQDTSGVANPSGTGGTFTAHHRPEYAFTASQPLFSGFREFAGLQAAGAARQARAHDRRRAAQLLFQDVSGAFYNVVQWDQQWMVLSVLRKSSEDRIKDLRERVRIGRSRQSELLAANSQLANIEAQLQSVQGLRLSSLDVLSFLTGERVEAVTDGTPDPSAPGDLEALVKKLPGRPDLMSQASQLQAASYSLSAARRAVWPTISASGNYYTRRVGTSAPIDWDVSLLLDAPLYRGGQVKASIDDAAAVRREREALASEAMRAAERDVRTLHAQLSSTVSEVERLSEAARLAEDTYKAQVKEYRLGLASNLDVLAALSAWEQSKLDFDGRRLDAKRLEAQLRVALGETP
jgi:outer membrane protein TolC